MNGTRSRGGVVRLLLFQTKHVSRKIDTMDSSSESDFKEETAFVCSLPPLYASRYFLLRIFFCYNVFMLMKDQQAFVQVGVVLIIFFTFNEII